MARGKEKKRKPEPEIIVEEKAENYAGITVRICGQENGLEVFENVSYVRVVSRRYNILIMKNYMPVLGRIDGAISFRTDREEISRPKVSGYFMHKENTFSLMLEDKPESEEEKAKADKNAKPEKRRKAPEPKAEDSAPDVEEIADDSVAETAETADDVEEIADDSVAETAETADDVEEITDDGMAESEEPADDIEEITDDVADGPEAEEIEDE